MTNKHRLQMQRKPNTFQRTLKLVGQLDGQELLALAKILATQYGVRLYTETEMRAQVQQAIQRYEIQRGAQRDLARLGDLHALPTR